MLTQCPNCRARDPGDVRCRRCGMELGLLGATQAEAYRLIRTALERIASGDNQAARSALERAAALQHDRFIDLLLAFAYDSRHAQCRRLHSNGC